jgi:carboxyl-terminal processing protease
MLRQTRRLALLAALLTGWAYLGSDRSPLPLGISQAAAVPLFHAESVDGKDKLHELTQLHIYNKIVIYVKENYVDPKRIKPKEMLVASLQYVEKTVPEVMIEGTAESGRLHLNVNGKAKDFDIHDVDSLWRMSFRLKDMMEFIAANMRPMEDTKDVEFAAIAGMLSTLDPHSVLLKPEFYREMKLTTKGEFGGLGFVIQMKEGNLTVVKVLPKTPAARAGIRKDDQIKKIGEESTVNMDLSEAVSKLRGPVDSHVSITLDRKGWEHPQPMTLTRATISIESVQSKLLADSVGYVRLKNFQGNTGRDLNAALNELTEKAGPGGLKGLVLDLRGNPGGLLDQAIQVSDMFLSQGTIVATVGFSNTMREEKHAHPDEKDNLYPVAVLVNAGSASASEIVAGALKNLNRAVIIGQQTFGKGSVQVLYEINDRGANPNDESALKLTIAKYLTPGDVSIQEVGIVPDIALVPTRVTAQRVNVFAPRKTIGEADLEHHFGNPDSTTVAKKRDDVVAREKPKEEVKYLKAEKPKELAKASHGEDAAKSSGARQPKAKKGEAGSDPLLDVGPGAEENNVDEELYDQLDAEQQDEVKEDFEVLFAKDFVLHAPFTEREKMIEAGKAFVESKRQEEEARINDAIAKLGLDWQKGPTPKNVALAATVKPGPEQKLVAGGSTDVEVTVENKGQEPLYRVRAWSDSDNPLLDRREFIFGALKPGEKRIWKLPLKLPKDLTSRRDDMTLHFYDDSGALPGQAVAELNFTELPRPAFALNWQVVDDCDTCNGDGLAERGERVQVVVDVTNTGTGKALDAEGSIKNAADQNIFIEKGRFHLGEMAPGETKTAHFVLEVKKGYQGQTFPLKLVVVDAALEEYSAEKLELPVSQNPLNVEARKGTVKVTDASELLSAPTEDAAVLAKLPHGAVLPLLGRVGSYDKVELDKTRFAWVRAQDAKEGAKGRAAPLASKDLQYQQARTPPQISLAVDPAQGGVVASGERYTLSGVAQDPKGLLDLYVLVNDQKVFFRTADPTKGTPEKMKFTTDFPLKDGNNFVMVVARQTPEFASKQLLVIRKRPSAVAAKTVGQGATTPPTAAAP